MNGHAVSCFETFLYGTVHKERNLKFETFLSPPPSVLKYLFSQTFSKCIAKVYKCIVLSVAYEMVMGVDGTVR